jgi:hypothetical protein
MDRMAAAPAATFHTAGLYVLDCWSGGWQWTRDGERVAWINLRAEMDRVRKAYREVPASDFGRPLPVFQRQVGDSTERANFANRLCGCTLRTAHWCPLSTAQLTRAHEGVLAKRASSKSSVDDYVGADNPVRFIDAFVDQLNLAAAGIHRRCAEGDGPSRLRAGRSLKTLHLRLFEPGPMEPAAGSVLAAADVPDACGLVG